MNEIQKINSAEKRVLKINMVVLSCYLLSIVDIINRSRFSAGVGAIKYSFSLAFGFVVIYIFKQKYNVAEKKNAALAISLIISAVYPTVTSSVVSWSEEGYSLILCIILYFLMTMVNLSSYNICKILSFYSIITLCISLWILYDFVNGIDLGWSSGVSITVMGNMKDPNYLAAFLVPGFTYLFYSFLFSEKKRLKTLFISIVVFCGIFFTGSRGAFLGLVLSIGIIVSKIIFSGKISGRKVILFFLVMLSILFAYEILMNSRLAARMLDAESYTGNIRWVIWGKALQAFRKHPIIGSGLQSGSAFSRSSTRFVTHNCFIDILTGQGIIGICLFTVSFWGILSVKRENRYFMLAMMASFFTPLFFTNGYEGITFWLPMIFCYQISFYCKNNSCENLLFKNWNLRI